MDVAIKRIADYLEKDISIKGWVDNFRSSGKIAFVILRDGTGFIQNVLVKNEMKEEEFESIKNLAYEDVVEIKGTVKKNDRAPGGYEILVKEFKIIYHYDEEEYPIQKKDHGVDFLLNHRHLWLRSKKEFATIMIRDEIIKAIRDYMYENDYVLMDSPILTPTAPEGTSTLFKTKYFDTEAYLSQSGQLYQEAGIFAFRKTYCFGPTFRAEKSKTKKHLTEFWMIEPEIAFCDMDELMEIEEDFVTYIVKRILEKQQNNLKILGRNIDDLKKITKPFYKISYTEAVEMVNKGGIKMEWGEDFGADEENIVSNHFDKPVFIHRFPKKIKPFYMEEDPNDPKVVLGVDLIAPQGYGEIIGGSQRVHDLKKLLDNIKKAGLSEENYKWYIDLRKWGSVPHSGFGLGLERTVAWITGIPHVRTAIPFPRTINRIYP